jgi:hypothetical protein
MISGIHSGFCPTLILKDVVQRDNTGTLAQMGFVVGVGNSVDTHTEHRAVRRAMLYTERTKCEVLCISVFINVTP